MTMDEIRAEFNAGRLNYFQFRQALTALSPQVVTTAADKANDPKITPERGNSARTEASKAPEQEKPARTKASKAPKQEKPARTAPLDEEVPIIPVKPRVPAAKARTSNCKRRTDYGMPY